MTSYGFTELTYRLKRLRDRWLGPARIVLIAGLIGYSTTWIAFHDTGREWDLGILKTFFAARGARPPPTEVIVAAIDDEAYESPYEGKFPSPLKAFPRKYVADVLQRIASVSPRVLILDLKFPFDDADPEVNERIIDTLRATPSSIWSGEIAKEFLGRESSGPADVTVVPSDPSFAEAAKLQLSMWVPMEFESIFHISDPRLRDESLYQRISLSRALVELGGYSLASPGPDDFINYYGPAGTVKHASFHAIVKADAAKLRDWFQGKVVLVGFHSVRKRITFGGEKEQYMTPVSDLPLFGVDIHANIAGNLLERSWLRRQPEGTERVILFMATLLMAGFAVALQPEWGVPLVLVLMGGATASCYLSFSRSDLWVFGLGTFLRAGFATILVCLFFHYGIAKRLAKKLRDVFNFELE